MSPKLGCCCFVLHCLCAFVIANKQPVSNLLKLQYLLVVAGTLLVVPKISWVAFCLFYPWAFLLWVWLGFFSFFLSICKMCWGTLLQESREIELREQGRCQLKVWVKDLPLSLDNFGSRNFFCSSAALGTSAVVLYVALVVSQSQNFLGVKIETSRLPFCVRLTCVFLVL